MLQTVSWEIVTISHFKMPCTMYREKRKLRNFWERFWYSETLVSPTRVFCFHDFLFLFRHLNYNDSWKRSHIDPKSEFLKVEPMPCKCKHFKRRHRKAPDYDIFSNNQIAKSQETGKCFNTRLFLCCQNYMCQTFTDKWLKFACLFSLYFFMVTARADLLIRYFSALLNYTDLLTIFWLQHQTFLRMVRRIRKLKTRGTFIFHRLGHSVVLFNILFGCLVQHSFEFRHEWMIMKQRNIRSQLIIMITESVAIW